MAPHKFSIGQRVVVRAGSAEGHIPSGVYTISRALPGDDFDRSYRICHAGDGHERVVREKQLEAHDGMAALRPDSGSASSAARIASHARARVARARPDGGGL